MPYSVKGIFETDEDMVQILLVLLLLKYQKKCPLADFLNAVFYLTEEVFLTLQKHIYPETLYNPRKVFIYRYKLLKFVAC